MGHPFRQVHIVFFRAFEAGQYCLSMAEAYPSPSAWIPAVPQHPWASWTDTSSHSSGQADRINCALQKPHFLQKSHTKHQLWYLTQNKMDLNMYDCYFLSQFRCIWLCLSYYTDSMNQWYFAQNMFWNWYSVFIFMFKINIYGIKFSWFSWILGEKKRSRGEVTIFFVILCWAFC